MKQTKITLEENEIPERWYNIVADMPNKPEPTRTFHVVPAPYICGAM